MRTSVAGPIAAHMQRQAILSRHEDTREALAQIGARGRVAARFREVAFPMASVKEHQSTTKRFSCPHAANSVSIPIPAMRDNPRAAHAGAVGGMPLAPARAASG